MGPDGNVIQPLANGMDKNNAEIENSAADMLERSEPTQMIVWWFEENLSNWSQIAGDSKKHHKISWCMYQTINVCNICFCSSVSHLYKDVLQGT